MEGCKYDLTKVCEPVRVFDGCERARLRVSGVVAVWRDCVWVVTLRCGVRTFARLCACTTSGRRHVVHRRTVVLASMSAHDNENECGSESENHGGV